MDRSEEQRLIRAAQRGDADAFAGLYREHVQIIFRYIYRRVSDTDLAEDLTGDVFMQALRGIQSYRDQGRPFIAWLYTIAHARVVDQYRRNGRRPTESALDDMPLRSEDDDLDRDVEHQQMLDALQNALTLLTLDQRQVITQRFLEGRDIESVAQRLGKTPTAVKALQHRALNALARHLQAKGIDLNTMFEGLS